MKLSTSQKTTLSRALNEARAGHVARAAEPLAELANQLGTLHPLGPAIREAQRQLGAGNAWAAATTLSAADFSGFAVAPSAAGETPEAVPQIPTSAAQKRAIQKAIDALTIEDFEAASQILDSLIAELLAAGGRSGEQQPLLDQFRKVRRLIGPPRNVQSKELLEALLVDPTNPETVAATVRRVTPIILAAEAQQARRRVTTLLSLDEESEINARCNRAVRR